MLEIKIFIDYYKLTKLQKARVGEFGSRHDRASSAENFYHHADDDFTIKHYLKRFKALGAAQLRVTIKKCEALGLLIN